MADHGSKFTKGLASYVWLRIWTGAVDIVTFGIAYPWTMCARYRWRIAGQVISGQQLKFDGRADQLFGQWIKWWALSIITIGIYGFWVPIKLIKWQTSHTYMPGLAAAGSTVTVQVQPAASA